MMDRFGIQYAAWGLIVLTVLGGALRTGAETAHPLQPLTVIGSQDLIQTLAGAGAFLDRDILDRHSHDDIGRILRRVPGVYIRMEDGYGLFPNISLRGVDHGRSSKVTIMEDNVLAAPAPYAAPAAYYVPATARMSAIEVLKGSSQIQYGPQTSGGVINFLSTPIPEVPGGRIRTLYGTEREIRNHFYFGGQYNTPAGRVGYLVELFDRRNDGFKRLDATPDFTERDQTGFRLTEPMLRLMWEPNTDRYQRFEFRVGYTELLAHETYMGLSDEDFSRDPNRRYAGSRFDRISTRMVRTHLRHQIEIEPNLQLTSTAYYHEFSRNWFKERTKGTDLADPDRLAVLRGEAPGALRYRNNNREYYSGGLETLLSLQTTTGDIDHDIDLGLRLHRDQVDRFQRDDTFVQAANGTITDRILGAPGSGGNREERATALALHFQNRMQAGAWTFVPGIRYERVDMTYRDRDTTGADPNRVTGRGSDTLDVVAPGFGLVRELNEETAFFGGIYRGFSLPGPRAYVRSGIKEETSIGYELGIRYNDRSQFNMELIAFYTEFDNLIVPDLIGAGGTQQGTENAGDILSYGLEWKATYDLGVAQEWGISNPWYISATWTRAELDSDTGSLDEESIFAGGRKGSKVPYIPEIQFLVGTGIETPRWGLFADVVFVDQTYTTASNVNGPFDVNGTPNSAFGKTDSFVGVDLSGHFRISDNMKLIGSIHNLFDETYLAARHPAGPRPGKPFTALAGIELSF